MCLANWMLRLKTMMMTMLELKVAEVLGCPFWVLGWPPTGSGFCCTNSFTGAGSVNSQSIFGNLNSERMFFGLFEKKYLEDPAL